MASLSTPESVMRTGEKRKREPEPTSTENEKQQQQLATRSLKSRVIFVNKVATSDFFVDCAKAAELESFLEAVRKQVPAIATSTTILNQSISAQLLILLQEVNVKNPYRRFFTINSEDTLGYSRWHTRNVLQTSEDKLKIEVHLVAEDDYEEMEAKFRGMGKGEKRGEQLKLHEPAEPWPSRSINPHKWRKWSEVGLDDINERTIEQCITIRSKATQPYSDQWFPIRGLKKIKKKSTRPRNRTTRHRPMHKKKAREQNGGQEAEQGEHHQTDVEMEDEDGMAETESAQEEVGNVGEEDDDDVSIGQSLWPKTRLL